MAILNENEQYVGGALFLHSHKLKGILEDFSQQGMAKTFQVVPVASSLSSERGFVYSN